MRAKRQLRNFFREPDVHGHLREFDHMGKTSGQAVGGEAQDDGHKALVPGDEEWGVQLGK
jgi:hypothetical protein